MIKLLHYLRGYIKESILGPLFKLLEAIFELLVPLVISSLIDTGIAGKNKSCVIQTGLLLVVLAVIGLVSSLTAQYFAAKASVGFTTKLRHELFRHIERLSYQDRSTIGASTLITRMTSDMNQVQTGLNLTLRLLLRSPFIVFGAMIMAFTISFKPAMIFVAVIAVLFVIVFFILLKSIPANRKVQLELDSVTGLMKENLAGARVIRAFRHEENERTEFASRGGMLYNLQITVGRISVFMNPATFVIINLAVAALIYSGALQVNTGMLTQGAVVALYNYMSQILVELIKLANVIINISKAIACGNRINAVLEIKPSITESTGENPPLRENAPIIEFRNVSFRYTGAGADALSNISFSVKAGETIGILGGTGSGKTTLINLLPRFYDATEGEVLFYGVNIDDIPIDELRRQIGIVPQRSLLFKGTIRENMRWGKQDSPDEDILRAIHIAQAGGVLRDKEGGLSHQIEQSGRNLSGGQRQRFAIARALVRQPKILILDDSSSALDYATDAALRKAIKSLEDTTVIIVSQRISSLQFADRILVLEDGKLEASGTGAELRGKSEVFREIESIAV